MIRKDTIGFLVIIALLVITGFFSLNLYFTEKKAYDKLDMHKFPYTVGDCQGKDLEITEREYQVLETRNLISREYTNADLQKIYLFIIYSETNRAVFHPPEVCLIGSGFTLVDKQTEKVSSDKYSFLTNKLYVEKNKSKEIILYSYKAGKLYTQNFYLQQIYLALHQIFGKQIPGATIRVSALVVKDEQTTLAVLKTFLEKTIKIVDSL